jgi:hypothetical protein
LFLLLLRRFTTCCDECVLYGLRKKSLKMARDPAKVHIYHITDVANLAAILAAG